MQEKYEILRQARDIRRESRAEKREAIHEARREKSRKIRERIFARKVKSESVTYNQRRILLLTRLRRK